MIPQSSGNILAMGDVTELMNAYRECSRNLGNVYFSKPKDLGDALDVFKHIRELLMDSFAQSELSCEGKAKGEDVPPPAGKVVPRERSLTLIRRLTESGRSWDQEKDLDVGPCHTTPEFVDYFDFGQIPTIDCRYCFYKILSFPSHVGHEGGEALVEALNVELVHDESAA